MMLLPFSLRENAAISDSSGTFSHSTVDSSYYDVTNLSVDLTVSGNRYVWLTLVPDGSSISYLEAAATSTTAQVFFRFKRGSTTIHEGVVECSFGGYTSVSHRVAIGTITHMDRPSAGTHTYKLQVMLSATNSSAAIYNVKLLAKELIF